MSSTEFDPAARALIDQGSLAQTQHAGALQQVARAQQEVQAEFIMARMYPRDEGRALAALLQSCARPAFAIKTAYSFPRGRDESGKPIAVTGPSVHLAREAARVWGNISYGIEIVASSAREMHVRGWARDNQSGVRVSADAKFAKLVYRKNKGWIEPDERDLRELVNRHGAIAERNALLKLLPPDYVDAALDTADQAKQAKGVSDLRQNPRQVAVHVIERFRRFGVTEGQIKEWLGGVEVHQMTGAQLAELRDIDASLTDGHTKPEDHFEPDPAKATPQAAAADLKTRADKLAAELAAKKAAAEGTPPEPHPEAQTTGRVQVVPTDGPPATEGNGGAPPPEHQPPRKGPRGPVRDGGA